MVWTRTQPKNLIAKFKILTINKQVYNIATVNYMMTPFEGNINIRD